MKKRKRTPMGSKRILTVAKVRALRKMNPPWSVIKIAKKFGLTRQGVNQFKRRHGIA